MITILGAVRYRYAHFGRGTGPIFIFRIGCSGAESSLLQCPWTHFQSGCSHYNDAGVRCEGMLKLILCHYSII